MRLITAILILAFGAGCGTTSPSRKTGLTRPPLDPVGSPAALETGTVDIIGVHGQVKYWDGSLWSALRPNMVLTNGAQIRPGADSTVNLRHDHCVTVRLLADHALNVQALVVRHLKGVGNTSAAPALEGGAIPFSTAPAPGSAALQIQAGGVMGRSRDADFAFYSDGRIEAVTGKVTVTERGKTWALRDGESLAPRAGTPESISEPGQTIAQSGDGGAWLVVSVPKAQIFELGTMNSWHSITRPGE
jgi:hypothetical protein